jgi:YVTN family beta-propeller protein
VADAPAGPDRRRNGRRSRATDTGRAAHFGPIVPAALLGSTSFLLALTLALAPGLAPAGASSRRAASPGDVAWVTTEGSVTEPGSAITPVDLTSHAAEPKVHVGSLPAAASLPSALAFTKDDAALLVVTRGDDKLSEVDPATHDVVRKVTVGLEPDAVAVAPGGAGVAGEAGEAGGRGLALVADLGDNAVTPVNLSTWKAGKPIPVGAEPVAIAVAGGTAFVADFGSNQVTPIDLATLSAGAPIAVGQGPETLAVAGGAVAGGAVAGGAGAAGAGAAGGAAAGAELLVGNFGDDTLTPIDPTTRQAGPPVPLPLNPTDIVVTSSGATAYIAGGASVVPLTVDHLAVGSPIALKGVAQALALAPGDGTAWVALQAGSLVPVSLTSRSVGHAIHLGGHPSALAIATNAG